MEGCFRVAVQFTGGREAEAHHAHLQSGEPERRRWDVALFVESIRRLGSGSELESQSRNAAATCVRDSTGAQAGMPSRGSNSATLRPGPAGSVMAYPGYRNLGGSQPSQCP